MSLNLSDMRGLLRQGLGGLDDQDLTDTEANRLLSMALWSLEDKFDFKEKECILEFDLVAGQRQYDLPDDVDALMGVAVRDDEQWSRLDRMDEDWYTDNYNEGSDHQALPERYMRIDDVIILHPTPDEAYRGQLTQWKELADETDLPRNWQEIVVEEAVVRGHFYHQDYNLAQMAANFSVGHQRQAVTAKNKEEEDSKNAGLEVRRDGKTNWK